MNELLQIFFMLSFYLVFVYFLIYNIKNKDKEIYILHYNEQLYI